MMHETFLYPHEAVLLATWFCLPPVLLGIVPQILLYRRRRVRPVRAVAALILSSLGTVLLAMLLWASLPAFLAAPLSFPSAAPLWFAPPFFLPAYLATFIVVLLAMRFVAEVRLAAPPADPLTR